MPTSRLITKGLPSPPKPEGVHQLLLLILFASVVVAASARGMRLLGPPAVLPDPWTLSLRILGTVTAVSALITLIVWGRGRQRSRPRRQGAALGAFRRAATIMGLLTLLALLAQPPAERAEILRGGPSTPREEPNPNREPGTDREAPPDGLEGRQGGASGAGGVGGGMGRSVPVTTPPQPDLGLFGKLAGSLPLNLLLLAGMIGLFWLIRRRRRHTGEEEDLSLAHEEATAGLELSLAELLGETGDPRGQVTAAYHRLLAALTAAGAGRFIQEAPHEHLYRVLGPLGVRPEPLHRLAELYVMAQFSERPVLDRHRAAAAEVLRESLANLRKETGLGAVSDLPGQNAGAPV